MDAARNDNLTVWYLLLQFSILYFCKARQTIQQQTVQGWHNTKTKLYNITITTDNLTVARRNVGHRIQRILHNLLLITIGLYTYKCKKTVLCLQLITTKWHIENSKNNERWYYFSSTLPLSTLYLYLVICRTTANICCTKYAVSNFNRSKDVMGVPKFRNWSRDLSHAPLGIKFSYSDTGLHVMY